MNINNLIIEVTRKCNLKCAHCLRGSIQNKALDFERLGVLLSNVDSIDSISIGGGEPTLARQELEKLSYILRMSRVYVGNISVVTNGKKTPEWFLDWFIDFYKNICNDNEMSGMGFSFDHWHNKALQMNLSRRNRNYYNTKDYMGMYLGEDIVRKHSDETWTPQKLLLIGRSAVSGLGYKILKTESLEIDGDNVYGDLYWTVDGKLLSSCDLSYSMMNKRNKFYITDWEEMCNTSLIDTILKYNERIGSFEMAGALAY